VAEVSAARPYGTLEPPILEGVTAVAFRIMGGEHIWIPKVLSSLFWLIGGVFLYLIVRRMASTDAAVLSTALYLFLPFGIWASTSFMPDPLMVMMLIISIFAMLRYHDNPSISRLVLAAAVSAFAVLVKPMCVFSVFGAFLALTILRQGLRRSIVDRHLLAFGVISLIPAVLYYGYGAFFTEGILSGYSQGAFKPYLLLHLFFWRGWATMVVGVLASSRHPFVEVGVLLFVMAAVGVLLFRRGVPRALMLGLWTGYFVFGLVFTLHIHSHSYYSLYLIPLVAISLAPVFDILTERLSQAGRLWLWRTSAYAGLVLLLLTATYTVIERGGYRLCWQTSNESYIANAKEVGEITGHSTNTVFLDPTSGFALQYYGELSGFVWPPEAHMEWMRLTGNESYQITAEEMFYRDYAQLAPEYFIVTWSWELDNQPDLRSFLGRFPVLAETDDYVIYDLRGVDWPRQAEEG
jgi:4-amino-4-deoxy-L-arabinose transferase-like glycosyltransferase